MDNCNHILLSIISSQPQCAGTLKKQFEEWTAYFHKALFLCYQTLTKVSNKMFPTIFHCRGWFVIPCHGRWRLCYSDKTSPIYKVVPWRPERIRLPKSWCKHLLVKLECVFTKNCLLLWWCLREILLNILLSSLWLEWAVNILRCYN